MRLIVMGSMNFCLENLKNLNNNSINVHRIILSDKKNNTEIIKWAKIKKIAYSTCYSSRDLLDILNVEKPDLVLCYAYSNILTKEHITTSKNGIINFHSSDLPRYRGRHPLNWAIVKGEDRIGMCSHFVDEGIDTGPIIEREYIIIEREDDIFTLWQKIIARSFLMTISVVNRIKNNNLKSVKQENENAFYLRKRVPDDSEIFFSKSCWEIHNLVRASADPYPNSFAIIGISKEKVLFSKSFIGNKPGVVLAKTECGKYIISCKDGVIMLESNTPLTIGMEFSL